MSYRCLPELREHAPTRRFLVALSFYHRGPTKWQLVSHDSSTQMSRVKKSTVLSRGVFKERSASRERRKHRKKWPEVSVHSGLRS